MADKFFEQNLYKVTAENMEEVIKSLPPYEEIMQSFAQGENQVELKRRFLLKKLDETWINAIEDTLGALDQVIHNPQSRLEEKEEVLPTAISKHINGRTVIHLSQNTNLITDVKEDGSVIPSKLLNVFSEDTILTYENKFINTLVNRLYAFIAIRYDGAKKCGEDEKQTRLTLTQKFKHQEYEGNISLSIEVNQEPQEHEVIKNYIYTSDLWKRMERLHRIVGEYMNDPFIKGMGKNFVRSPVLRTNTILKNPLFKSCLSLWEFIESYEATGYEALVQEDLLSVDDKLLHDIYNSIAEQYVVYQNHIQNGFEDEKQLNSRLLNIQPNIKDEFDELNEEEFDYRTLVPGILKNDGTIEYPDDEMEIAILVALAADAMMWQDEIDEEESVIDEKGEIVYKYKYSFLGRLIKAQLPTQDYYNDIKNDLLSYKGVKAHMSWPRETFKRGLDHCCRLNCKGKTLFVYLPLNPNEFDKAHYHHLDVSKEGEDVEYPFLLKVRSRRACKYAIELIAIVMHRLGIVKNDAYVAQDFHIGPMSIEEMLEKDYARLIGEKAPPKKPVEEVIPEDDASIAYRYKFSYSARLIRSGDERQDLYNAMKNEVLSYKKVTSKISWSHELFKNGRNKVCLFKVKGKTLCVYLPLNPDNFDQDHYHFKDNRVEGKEVEFPLYMRITSLRAVKYCAELLAIVMANFGLEKNEAYEAQDYKLPYMSINEMLVSDPVLAKLIEGATPPKKEEVPAPVNEEDEDGISYRYKFSYSARLIRSGDERQELYNNLKNHILSYRKVNSKISWSHELFKLGRNKICLFKVKGKTLCVYMPLNPDNYDAERMHFADLREEGKDVEFPLMMKIKSDRAVKYASELIDEVMKNFDIPHNDEYVEQNYKLPYMSINEMLVSDPILAKLIEGAEMPKPEPVAQPVNDEEDEDGISYRYKFSFSARLIRSGEERQDLYNNLKNHILSYKKVNSKISWNHELFKLGRNKICLFKVKGKTLCVYMPLNPDNYDADRMHFVDLREEGKDVEFPLMLKVKSDRAVKYASELIDEVMKNFDIPHNDEYVEQNYKLPYMSINQMLVSDPVLAKLIEGAEMPKPEPVPVAEEPVNEEEDEDGINYRYKFSFSARLIRSGDERQELYSNLKNHILSYKKVNSKISWNHELFKLGRNKICIFKVKGKTLCVYMPLNPDNYDAERMHFVDLREEGKEVEFPLMLKVKSDRAVKYASELIDEVMKNFEIPHNDDYVEQNYKLPYMSIGQMLVSDPVLAKLIEGAEMPKPEPTPVVVEPINDEEEEDGINYRYKFSFSARLIRSGDDRQDLYNNLKNNILSYKKVNSKISWSHELFKLGRNKICLFKVKGKTLCVYMPLNPDNYDAERMHFVDLREEGKDVEFPLMMKIKSDRAVKYASELIDEVMKNFDIPHNDEYVEQNYKLPYMSINQMLVSDPVLAKLIEGAEMPKPEPTPVVEEPVIEEIDEDKILYKYKFSYSARLIRSGLERQELYNDIKNYVLSYKKITNKISWGHELFKLGRNKICVFKVKGKTLCVYMPLNPDKYDQERLHFVDLRRDDKEVEFPLMLKVKSSRGVKYACELLKDVLDNFNCVKKEENYSFDYKLNEMSLYEMIDAGLIKVNDGVEVPVPEVKVEPVQKEEPKVNVLTDEEKEVADEISSNVKKGNALSRFFAKIFRRK